MRILVSYSGGRSSARMVPLVREQYPDAEIVFGIANTGQEHPKTWEFVRKCDEHFGMNLVIVEADVNPDMNEGTRHRIVTYETLSMDGRPFEDVIRKYGIPNENYPHCTREMKDNALESYLRSIGWEAGSYTIALGIRWDEPKRLPTEPKPGFIYPLADAGIDKLDVLEFWRGMPFDLELKEREGNCTWCWKKSETKHILNAQHNPEWYDFPARMEDQYRMVRPERGDQVFFRGHKTARQMVALAKVLPVQMDLLLNRPDEDAGCAEACPAFAGSSTWRADGLNSMNSEKK